MRTEEWRLRTGEAIKRFRHAVRKAKLELSGDWLLGNGMIPILRGEGEREDDEKEWNSDVDDEDVVIAEPNADPVQPADESEIEGDEDEKNAPIQENAPAAVEGAGGPNGSPQRVCIQLSTSRCGHLPLGSQAS